MNIGKQLSTEAEPSDLAGLSSVFSDSHRLLALQAISSRISAVSGLDALLEELVHSVAATLDGTCAAVFLVDEEEQLYVAASSHPLTKEARARRFPIGGPEAVGRAACAQTPTMLADEPGDDAIRPRARSRLLCPMLTGGRLIGLFDLESAQPGAFGERDVQWMTILTNHAAASIESLRLLQESQANAVALARRASDLLLLNHLSTRLNASLDAHEILSATVQQLVELLDMDYGGALILKPGDPQGQIAFEHPAPLLPNVQLTLPGASPVSRILAMGVPYVIQTPASHPFIAHLPEVCALGFGSLLLIPLVAWRNLIGVLILASREAGRRVADEHIDLCQTIASQAAAAIANARLMQDIRQQRRALARKSQEMTEESAKLDAVLNTIADGLVVTDPSGRILLSNPAFRKLAGLPSAQAADGRSLIEMFPINGLENLLAQAIESPTQVFTDDLQLLDGRVLRTSAQSLRIRPSPLEAAAEEEVAGVVTVLRDVTHEVEIDRMKTEFISSVSHELRTPLTSILGFTHLAQHDLREVAAQCSANQEASAGIGRILDNLSIVEKESQRLTQLVSDVLDIAKIEAGPTDWPMEVTVLSEVVNNAVVAVMAQAEEKRLPIHVELPPAGLPLVRGNYRRLVQALTHLLSNAVKFTRQGSIRISGYRVHVADDGGVSVEPRSARHDPASGNLPPGDWVAISVTDTGIGIAPGDLSRIFEKFTQIGDTLTDKPAGTGLGLPICKGIIEYHGGRVWVESKPGKGSTFTFALPVEPFPMDALEETGW